MLKQADRFAEVIKFKRQRAYGAFGYARKAAKPTTISFFNWRSLYNCGYGHVCLCQFGAQGEFELANYVAINAWLERVKAQPDYIDISAAS
jgi:glutathione S-transferase